MDERVEAFLNELEILSIKYGLHLWACSCCNAINVIDTETDHTLIDCILYNVEKGKYTEYGD